MASATFESVIPSLLPFQAPRPVQALLGRALGISAIARIYERMQAMGDAHSIADRLLQHLSVACHTSDADLARIPKTGPAILTLNHPFGILEGAVMASLLARIRADVRFLANGILTAVPEIRDMVIPVDLVSGKGNSASLRRTLQHLESGGLLVIFPAGEVSRFQWRERAVADPQWNPIAARLVRLAKCRPAVIPAYVRGANSPVFHLAPAILRTALLARELLNKRGRTVEVRIGAPVSSEKLLAIPTAREQTEYLRWRTYLLAKREQYKPLTSFPLRRTHTAAAPIAGPVPPPQLASEIESLPGACRLNAAGGLAVYVASAAEIPQTLREIARLREITFRAAGEGTGKSLDLDEFDQQYLHLFVWNSVTNEVVGAYRLTRTDVVRELYTATLFEYGAEFRQRLGPAIELGRSFVRQEYQKGFAPLLLLWKGIGAYVARHPQYKTLFGPVSISNQYEAVSRELMVSFLEKYAMLRDWRGLVRDRNPFRRRHLNGPNRPAFPDSGFDVEDLSSVVSDIEQKPAGVPVLLRQYLKLGGKLLGFNVDPNFSNALDGLILVDLTRTEPRLLERYLGKSEASRFLAFQKGNHGTH